MGFKFKMPKIKIPNPVQAIQQAVAPVINTVANTGNNVINTVIKETPKGINFAGQQITDGAGMITSQGEQFARNSINAVHGIGISAAGQAKVGAARHGAWMAKVAEPALNDMDAGSKLAIRAMEQGAKAGVYGVARGGELIAEWAEANYCQIGVSVGLGTIFAALLYRPEPSSQATTVAATAPLVQQLLYILQLRKLWER